MSNKTAGTTLPEPSALGTQPPAEHKCKSPRELMNGQDRPHRLMLLGFDPLQPHRT
jgi:hypothetical protein